MLISYIWYKSNWFFSYPWLHFEIKKPGPTKQGWFG